MQYTVKKHSKDEFYETFLNWCDLHKFPKIPDITLPENVFVCYKEEVPIYAIWFYHTDSKMSHIAYPISNKKVSYNSRRGGLEFLINEVVKYARRKKIVCLFTTSGTEEVVGTLIKCGFVEADKNVTQFVVNTLKK